MILNVSVVWLAMIMMMLLLTYKGYVNGMIKELLSLFSIIVLIGLISFLARWIEQFKTENYYFIVEVLIVFMVLMLFIKIGRVFLIPIKLIVNFSIVKYFDQLLGIVVGVIKTVLYLKIISIVVLYFLKGTSIERYFSADIMKSELVTAIVHNNYFIVWLENLL